MALTVVGTAVTAGSTGTVTLQLLQRKVQGKAYTGFQADTEEWNLLKSAKIPKKNINISAREITNPINIRRATHAAIIPEGGYENNPTTVALNEVTFTWSNYNITFPYTKTARYLAALGQDNTVGMAQLRYQIMKAIEGHSDTVGRDFYGFSTGIWCGTTTTATSASQTLTLANLYGVSGLGTTAQLGSLFAVGDRIAIFNGSSVITNGLGTITAVTESTPSIAVTMVGSAAVVSGYNIVLAGSRLASTTGTDSTNYNKALVGLRDGATTASIHGLSSSTEGYWAAGYSDTGGGRWSGVKLRKAKQGIKNRGGGTADFVIWDQGVSNDVFASQSGALRFSDPTNMPLDGKATDPGTTFFDSRKVPSGDVYVMDRSNCVEQFSLLDYPGMDAVGPNDGDKMEGQNADVFSIDHPLALCWKNRSNLAFFSGITVQ